MAFLQSYFVLVLGILGQVAAKPGRGVWDVTVSKDEPIHWFSKTMYNKSEVFVTIFCEGNLATKLTVTWLLRRSPCAEEYVNINATTAASYLHQPGILPPGPKNGTLYYTETEYMRAVQEIECHNGMLPPPPDVKFHVVTEKPPAEGVSKASVSDAKVKEETGKEKPSGEDTSPKEGESKREKRAADDDEGKSTTTIGTTTVKPAGTHALAKVWQDGVYLFVIKFEPQAEKDVKLKVNVKMSYKGNYLSADVWPLLIFYGVMGLVYIGYGIFWLAMLACNWRDLLRVQFWIGGVICLGMLEKAVFFGEFENINKTGEPVNGAIIFAELVSCLKRTLARMLVVIVSYGLGIVKPRLGQTFHKVLIAGIVYFVLASVESCIRAVSDTAEQSRQQMIANVPLAVVDALICWWIFSLLLQTTRTLRLRRNVVKLSLYRHFTNTLIFCVLASIGYMIWMILQRWMVSCQKDWQELWLDDAFWHLLFSIILFVIIILWRPSASNQRYAFSPLLDAAEDDIDDDQVLSEAYEGMKMRTSKTQQRNGSPKVKDDHKGEDDLKWVEDNIPSSLADRVLPALDSDEEIMNTKFEISKMQ